MILWFLELILGAHCSAWRMTSHGWRCVAPLDRPRIELVAGWHRALPSGEVCSVGCGPEYWPGETRPRS